MNENLLKCPFCGSEAEMIISNMWGAQGASVKCPCCHIRTTPISEGVYTSYHGEQDKHFTLAEAEAEAARRWNARTEAPAKTRYLDILKAYEQLEQERPPEHLAELFATIQAVVDAAYRDGRSATLTQGAPA